MEKYPTAQKQMNKTSYTKQNNAEEITSKLLVCAKN
jgi:hypothetical protein